MSKYLGTLNVDAGDAGTISLEISTDTPLERVAAVLRFADEMTTAKPDVVALAKLAVPEPVAKPDVVALAKLAVPEPVVAPDPPLPVKTRKPRAATKKATPPKTPDEAIECDVCGKRCNGASTEIAQHRWRVQRRREEATARRGGAGGGGVRPGRGAAPLWRLRLRSAGHGVRVGDRRPHAPQASRAVVGREEAAHAGRRRRGSCGSRWVIA